MTDVQVLVEVELPDECDAFVSAAASSLWSVASHLFEDRGLVVPEVKVVVTDDIMAVADRENAALGLDADRRSGVERIGGVVGGKTMCSDSGDRAVVIIASALAGDPEGAAKYWAAGTIAHEYGHLLYGAARIGAIGRTENVWLPWDIASMIGVLAAEEYRVNRIGHALVDQALPATDETGAPVSLASIVGWRYIASLIEALDSVVPGMSDVVNAYRTHQTTLDEMWAQVVRISEEITLYCAHAETHYDGEVALFELLPAHPGRELLKAVWEPLATHFDATQVLPQPEEWAADRKQIEQISKKGWMDAWNRLGLRPTPLGDGYHLAVDKPQV